MPKPTLIVSPNDTVASQWRDTLIKAGVSRKKIFHFVPRDKKLKLLGGIYSLCTRYQLQTEMKKAFDSVESAHPVSSPLFPNAPKKLVHGLKQQYL